jgi:site-specific DNA-adenine methylase
VETQVLVVANFAQSLGRAGRGDVVYCDPTYRKRTRQHFDRYGATLFGWGDQQRLALAATAAVRRGALVIVSNASCFGVSQLYSEALILEVHRRKGLGPGDAVTTRAEYLFVLDPLER